MYGNYIDEPVWMTTNSGNLRLYHYRARAYDPAAGRFMQRDPLGVDPAGIGNNSRFAALTQYAAGMNLYRYVTNNPILLLDSVGLHSYSEEEQNYYSSEMECCACLASRRYNDCEQCNRTGGNEEGICECRGNPRLEMDEMERSMEVCLTAYAAYADKPGTTFPDPTGGAQFFFTKGRVPVWMKRNIEANRCHYSNVQGCDTLEFVVCEQRPIPNP